MYIIDTLDTSYSDSRWADNNRFNKKKKRFVVVLLILFYYFSDCLVFIITYYFWIRLFGYGLTPQITQILVNIRFLIKHHTDGLSWFLKKILNAFKIVFIWCEIIINIFLVLNFLKVCNKNINTIKCRHY